jgi:ferrous iron transport protein B
MLLIPAFFPPAWRAPMLWTIYMIGIILAFVLALVLRRSILKGDDAPFVMELPPYRLPTLRALGSKMMERSYLYLRKAGTVILGISILMWFITSYPKPPHFAVDQALREGKMVLTDGAGAASSPAKQTKKVASPAAISPAELTNLRAAEALRYSIAGRIGRAIEPLIRPLGFDWKLGTAMIGAFAAKEVFVAQLGIVYALGDSSEGNGGLQQALRNDYSPIVGLSLMLFLLIATPCMATFAVTRRESGHVKWAVLQQVGLTGIAYCLSFLVYQLGAWIYNEATVSLESFLLALILMVTGWWAFRRLVFPLFESAAHESSAPNCAGTCSGCSSVTHVHHIK